MRIQNWNGHDIRFVKLQGDWHVIIGDICSALGLSEKIVNQKLPAESTKIAKISMPIHIPDVIINTNTHMSKIVFNDYIRTYMMPAGNEIGVYKLFFNSSNPENIDLCIWCSVVFDKLNYIVTEKEIDYESRKLEWL